MCCLCVCRRARRLASVLWSRSMTREVSESLFSHISKTTRRKPPRLSLTRNYITIELVCMCVSRVTPNPSTKEFFPSLSLSLFLSIYLSFSLSFSLSFQDPRGEKIPIRRSGEWDGNTDNIALLLRGLISSSSSSSSFLFRIPSFIVQRARELSSPVLFQL